MRTKMDFSELTIEQIQKVEDKLFNRPRKRFGFLSPLEQLNKVLTNEQKVAFATWIQRFINYTNLRIVM